MYKLIYAIKKIPTAKIFFTFGALLTTISLYNSLTDIGFFGGKKGDSESFYLLNLITSCAGIIFVFLSYLQSGKGFVKNNGKRKVESSILHMDTKLIKNKLLDQEESLDLIRSDLLKIKKNNELSEEDRSIVIAKNLERINNELIEEIFKIETTKLEEELKNKVNIESIETYMEEIKIRISREISDLRLRANVNLIIGMVITLSGLALLWNTVSIVDSSNLPKRLDSYAEVSNSQFIKTFIFPLIPRISLVIFIEVFAYFFLRLYKDGLNEIKFFQNEMTNIESKLIALKTSHLLGHKDALNTVIESLCQTERNFLLTKKQTTVELEKAKSYSGLGKDIVKILPSIFKDKKE